MRPLENLRRRIIDVIMSIYLFNEQRGFKHLDELASIFEQKFPDQTAMLRSIRKHAADERNHYRLFCDYFLNRGYMPYAVGPWCGYCDQIVKLNFGVYLDEVSAEQLLEDDETFFRLCRMIMITEMRGMQQVEVVLHHWLFRDEPELKKIFAVVKRDEPSHCYPYQRWLRTHGRDGVGWRERLTDLYINYSLMLWKIPLLVLSPTLRAREEFPTAYPQLA